MRTITARFNSKCQATGQTLKKGELIAYDPETRKAYKLGHEPKESEEDRETRNTRAYIDAQEDAAIRNGNY